MSESKATTQVGTITLPVVPIVSLEQNLPAPTPVPAPVVVPICINAETQKYLEALMAEVPKDKRGVAHLVIDLKGVELGVGTHIWDKGKIDVDAGAGCGRTWAGNVFAGAEIRVEW